MISELGQGKYKRSLDHLDMKKGWRNCSRLKEATDMTARGKV